MKYDKDHELKKRYLERDELINLNKNMRVKKLNSRFLRMTGLTIDEKMFQNMISFYKPELKKVMNSNNESNAISKLSNKVRKTLKRNRIIIHGRRKYEITQKARDFLNLKPDP